MMQATVDRELKSVHAAIEKGIQYLLEQQMADGELQVKASNNRSMRDAAYDASIFATCIGAYGLRFIGGSSVATARARRIAEGTLSFLQEQMLGPGLWSYWSSKSKIRVPADLDDVACASMAFAQWERKIPSNREAVLANRNDQGLFRTWLVDSPYNPAGAYLPQRHRDNVDPVVNANVVAYLGECPETLPAIAYVEQAVRSKPMAESMYYPGTLPLCYAVSRAYHRGVTAFGSLRGTLIEAASASHDKDADGRELLDALSVLVFLNLGAWSESAQRKLSFLLRQQDARGAWPCAPAYLGPAPFYGSEELTTVYVVEALSRWANGAFLRTGSTRDTSE